MGSSAECLPKTYRSVLARRSALIGRLTGPPIVVGPTPIVFAIFRQENPCVRSSRAPSRWNNARGLPMDLFRFKFHTVSPASTRHEPVLRSGLALVRRDWLPFYTLHRSRARFTGNNQVQSCLKAFSKTPKRLPFCCSRPTCNDHREGGCLYSQNPGQFRRSTRGHH
jgi:hypothetical protein